MYSKLLIVECVMILCTLLFGSVGERRGCSPSAACHLVSGVSIESASGMSSVSQMTSSICSLSDVPAALTISRCVWACGSQF